MHLECATVFISKFRSRYMKHPALMAQTDCELMLGAIGTATSCRWKPMLAVYPGAMDAKLLPFCSTLF